MQTTPIAIPRFPSCHPSLFRFWMATLALLTFACKGDSSKAAQPASEEISVNRSTSPKEDLPKSELSIPTKDMTLALKTGRSLVHAKKHTEAIALFKEALVRFPDAPLICSELSALMLQQGAPEEAASYARKALVHAEGTVRGLAYYNLGVAQESQGLSDQANTSFRESLKLRPHAFVEKKTGLTRAEPTLGPHESPKDFANTSFSTEFKTSYVKDYLRSHPNDDPQYITFESIIPGGYGSVFHNDDTKAEDVKEFYPKLTTPYSLQTEAFVTEGVHHYLFLRNEKGWYRGPMWGEEYRGSWINRIVGHKIMEIDRLKVLRLHAEKVDIDTGDTSPLTIFCATGDSGAPSCASIDKHFSKVNLAKIVFP